MEGDKRLKLVEAAMKRHSFRPDALLEVLHTTQELYGYLSGDLLRYIAEKLDVPPARVFGVATFYHFFSLAPKGEHTCVVCLGTACYVKGASALAAAVENTFHLKPGQTTPDHSLSFEIARCLGACGIAPAAVVDGEVCGHAQETQLVEDLRRRCAGRSV